MDVGDAVSAYRCTAKIPVVVSASLLPISNSIYKIQSVWQQRDLERAENVKFSKSVVFNFDGSNIEQIAEFPPTELKKELLSCVSNCGKKTAIIREVTTKESKKVQYLEIWDNGKKTVNVNLTDADKHDTVLSDSQFGSLEWSKNDKKLLYIAEKKLAKTCSFFKLENKDDEKPGNEHLWKETWGEQLTDSHQPTLCVFDVETNKLSVFSDHISDDLSVGQAIWLNDDERVVFVGWTQVPYRLGLLYCPIRESRLFLINTATNVCKQLSDNNVSVRSPRVHPSGKSVYYLQNSVGGPHMPCAKLMAIDFPILDSNDLKPKVIVDEVRLPKSFEDFHGIYAMLLPRKCWDSDGRFLFMTTARRSHKSVIAVNVGTGEVRTITTEGDYNVLDVHDNVVIAAHSTPSTPPEIVVAKSLQGKLGCWYAAGKPCGEVENVTWSVHSYVPDEPNDEYPNVGGEYILLKPPSDISNKNLIVFPHGGPHSHCSTTFTHTIATMCQLGFTVVQVNYRGSIGFGQDCINSLTGRVGKQDVYEVQQVAELVKKKENCDKVFITGGSHGGFLSLHLIGQFPDFYRAAAVRNPVVNMSVMSGVTDIMDWTYCESMSKKFEFGAVPTPDDYATMLAKSPISVIKHVKVPCLMMLGDCDLRCPPSQGIQWVKTYKALGGNCKLLIYKDNNHPIAKVDAEADAFVNVILWFRENMQ